MALAAFLVLCSVLSPKAAAQGCALCYQSAAAAGSRAISALRNGIIVLIVPPFLICTAISFLVYRRRNLQGEDPGV